jgi:hypothetical protein
MDDSLCYRLWFDRSIYVACPQHPGCDFVWSCLTCPNRRGPGATKLTIRYTAYLIAITFGASGIALEFNQLWQTASIFFMFGFVVVTAVLVQWLHEVL